MSGRSADELYRQVIDRIVDDCQNEQGQVRARRVREGVWNSHATSDFVPEQHAVNVLLASLSEGDREILAGLLTDAFEAGAFTALGLPRPQPRVLIGQSPSSWE